MVLSQLDKDKLESIRNNAAGRRVESNLLEMFEVYAEECLNIDTEYGRCNAYIYYPYQTDTRLPVLFNVHGGGFVKGRREQDIVFSRNMCKRLGCVVVDIDYTPAPELRFPGQIYQVHAVIAYFREHASDFGMASQKFGITGHSAGGTISCAVALLAASTKAFQLKLQMLNYSGFDLYTPERLKKNAYGNPRISPEQTEFYTRMYLNSEDKLKPLASPLYAPDEMLANLPETLIIACEDDFFWEESMIFANRLSRLGVTVTSKTFKESSHGFLVQRKDEFEQAESIIKRCFLSIFE